MNDRNLVTQFKNAFVEASYKCVPLWRTPLKDFLDHDVPETACPYEFAARALVYFCTEDGAYNGFEQGIVATAMFLQNVTQSRLPSEEHLNNLRTILENDATSEALVGWARRAFPVSG